MKYKILFFSEYLGAGGGGIASKRIIDSFKKHETRVISLVNEKNIFFIVKYYLIRFYYRFKRFFDLMSIQRHLKAIGIFSRLNYRDGKQNYLKDIPRTLNYIYHVSENYKELNFLRELIANIK